MQPRSYSVLAQIAGSGKIVPTQAFEYEGEIVIVATWLVLDGADIRVPELVIPLRLVGHQRSDHPDAPAQIVTDPLPEAIFAGTASPSVQKEFGVFRVQTPMPDPEPGASLQ